MKSYSIQKSTLKFLKDLEKNNNREWFNAHKSVYLSAQQNVYDFIEQLIIEMNKHDVLEGDSGKGSLFRIYKDVRFSKDKSPYNPRFAFSFQRATKLRRGGYYVHLKPGNCFMGCGFFTPNPEDLKRIRQDIDANFSAWKKLLRTKSIVENFGEIQGETVATAPKGFSKDNPAIELLRHKAFTFRHDFKDDEVLEDNFLKEVNSRFKAIRPYFNYMSELLTTNLNGESTV
jgi:uncharacterized protein (TIGR02453 family)